VLRVCPMGQAAFHVVLLAGGGIVLYAIALLTSSLVEGEYTAPMVSFGILVLVGSPQVHCLFPDFINDSCHESVRFLTKLLHAPRC
jgi:hypothetical protein